MSDFFGKEDLGIASVRWSCRVFVVGPDADYQRPGGQNPRLEFTARSLP